MIAHPLSAIRLPSAKDPKDGQPLAPYFDRTPISILVIGDMLQRPDTRVLEDRRELRLRRDNVGDVMRRQKLSLNAKQLGLGEVPGRDVLQQGDGKGLRFSGLDDFTPHAVAAQLGQLGVDAGALDALTTAVLRSVRFVRLRDNWQAISDVAAGLDDWAHLEVVNAELEDLLMDFEDSPELSKSGAWRHVHRLNHLGMQPFSALVLLHQLSHEDAYLLNTFAELAVGSHLVVLADAAETLDVAHPNFTRWAEHPNARHLALCAPGCSLGAGRAVMPGLAALTVARMMLAGFARLDGPHGYASEAVARGSIQLRDAPAKDGLLQLLADGDTLRASTDRSGYRGGALSASLTERLFCARVGHIAQHSHAFRSTACWDMPMQEQLDRTNDGLRIRLANLEHVHAQVVNASKTLYGVEGTLEITVTGEHPARFDEPITLRPN